MALLNNRVQERQPITERKSISLKSRLSENLMTVREPKFLRGCLCRLTTCENFVTACDNIYVGIKLY